MSVTRWVRNLTINPSSIVLDLKLPLFCNKRKQVSKKKNTPFCQCIPIPILVSVNFDTLDSLGKTVKGVDIVSQLLS